MPSGAMLPCPASYQPPKTNIAGDGGIVNTVLTTPSVPSKQRPLWHWMRMSILKHCMGPAEGRATVSSGPVFQGSPSQASCPPIPMGPDGGGRAAWNGVQLGQRELRAGISGIGHRTHRLPPKFQTSGPVPEQSTPPGVTCGPGGRGQGVRLVQRTPLSWGGGVWVEAKAEVGEGDMLGAES